MSVHLSTRRFTVQEFRHMAEAGILAEDERVELIEGEIAEMPPVGGRHAACVKRLNRLFGRLGDAVIVSVQDLVYLDERSEPQPDVALLRPRADFYADGHPRVEDILLVIEVAETSASTDRHVKMPLYARNLIPEAWLVDLNGDAIFVHRDPGPEGYRSVRVARRGEPLAPLAFPELEIAVDEILGGR